MSVPPTRKVGAATYLVLDPEGRPIGQYQRVERDMNYQDRIRSLPCLICGRVPSECAHIRFSDFKFNKVNPGLAGRSHDRWCVPLCSEHHRGPKGQHSRGERQWWEARKIDPLEVARDLWDARDDYELQLRIVRLVYFSM